MAFKTAPVPGSFMLIGIFGFLASALYWEEIGASWAFTLAIMSIILFVASLMSMRESVEIEEIRRRKARKGKKK